MNGWILLIFAVSFTIEANSIERKDFKLGNSTHDCSDSALAVLSADLILEETIFYGVMTNCELFYFQVPRNQSFFHKVLNVKKILEELEAVARRGRASCLPDDYEVILRRDGDEFVFETFERGHSNGHIEKPMKNFSLKYEGMFVRQGIGISSHRTSIPWVASSSSVGGSVSITIAKPGQTRPYGVYLKNVHSKFYYRCLMAFSSAENVPYSLRAYVLSGADKVIITRIQLYGSEGAKLLGLSYYTFIISLVCLLIFVLVTAANLIAIGILTRSAKKLMVKQQKIESFLDECLGETKLRNPNEVPPLLEMLESSTSVSQDQAKKESKSSSMKHDPIKLRQMIRKKRDDDTPKPKRKTSIKKEEKQEGVADANSKSKALISDSRSHETTKTDLRSFVPPPPRTAVATTSENVPPTAVSDSKTSAPPSDCSLRSYTESVRSDDYSALGISGASASPKASFHAKEEEFERTERKEMAFEDDF